MKKFISYLGEELQVQASSNFIGSSFAFAQQVIDDDVNLVVRVTDTRGVYTDVIVSETIKKGVTYQTELVETATAEARDNEDVDDSLKVSSTAQGRRQRVLLGVFTFFTMKFRKEYHNFPAGV